MQPPLLGFSAPQAVPAEAPEGHVQPPPPGFVSAPQPTQAEQGLSVSKAQRYQYHLLCQTQGQHIVPPEVATHEDDTLAERKAPMPSQAQHGQTWQAEAPHGHTWRVPAAVPMLPGPRLAPQVPLPSSQHAAPQQVEHLQPLVQHMGTQLSTSKLKRPAQHWQLQTCKEQAWKVQVWLARALQSFHDLNMAWRCLTRRHKLRRRAAALSALRKLCNNLQRFERQTTACQSS